MKDFRTKKSNAIWLVIASGVYYVTAIIGMQVFSLQPQNITLLWLPPGIGLIMCLKFGWQAYPGIFIASFAANLPGMMTSSFAASISHTAIAGATDALTPLFAAWLLQQKIPGQLFRSKQLFSFCFYVCLLPTAISAFVLSANLTAGGYIAWSQSLFVGTALILADSLGILLVYPVFASWKPRSISANEILSFALAGTLSLIFTAAAFHGFPSMIYLVLPTLLYLAASGYHMGHSVVLFVTVVAILSFAARGFGPFMSSEFEDALMRLMTFVFSTTLVSQSIMLHRGELIESAEARELWYQRAIRDTLTGLYNRTYFLSQLDDELARSQRTGHRFVLAMIDVDFFKQINDQYGHPFGDKVLQALAHKLQKLLRSADVVARIGGEEFAVLMSDASLQEAMVALERLRTKLATDGLIINHQRFSITVSIGACENATHSAETLINTADKLLYRAKHQGRNCLITNTMELNHSKAD
ncbi:MAG: diguanylate cyclase [Cyanobacteria bacterium J06639_16]